MELIITVKESDPKRIKKVATQLAQKLRDNTFDIETGGLLFDLLRGCGLTSQEIASIRNEK